MQVFSRLPSVSHRTPTALTIGNFDGVHRGHQALLALVARRARELGVASAVLTFEPHPREFFAASRRQARGQAAAPGPAGPAAPDAPLRISLLRDKLMALREAGIERVCIARFNTPFARLSAEEFIEEVLVGALRVRHLVVGDDFRFGAGRRGDLALLNEAARRAGFSIERVPSVEDEGLRISSSAVRAALTRGDFDQAAQLLGRPYRMSGRVVRGRQLGRTLGFPTLNLRIPHGRPAVAGIHVVRVHGLGPEPLAGVASLGTRPAVDRNGAFLLETHVFDYSGDAYGRLVSIEFLRKLRDEAHYDTLEALTAQIRRDAEQARQHFAALILAG